MSFARSQVTLTVKVDSVGLCQVPGYGDVKVSVESVPQSVVLGTTFSVLLKVINCS